MISKEKNKEKTPQEHVRITLKTEPENPLLHITTFKKARYRDNIKMVFKDDIDDTLAHAATLERKRAPILIHESFEESPQRFVNCLEVNTYVRPHMHMVPNQWELMCWLSGEITIFLFDDHGTITSKILMNKNNALIVETPPFRYHAFIATEKSAYLEIRNGKFAGSIDRIYSAWSPEENSPGVADYQRRLAIAEEGDSLRML